MEDLFASQAQTMPPELLLSEDDLQVKLVNPRVPHGLPPEVLDGRAVHPFLLQKLDPVRRVRASRASARVCVCVRLSSLCVVVLCAISAHDGGLRRARAPSAVAAAAATNQPTQAVAATVDYFGAEFKVVTYSAFEAARADAMDAASVRNLVAATRGPAQPVIMQAPVEAPPPTFDASFMAMSADDDEDDEADEPKTSAYDESDTNEPSQTNDESGEPSDSSSYSYSSSSFGGGGGGGGSSYGALESSTDAYDGAGEGFATSAAAQMSGSRRPADNTVSRAGSSGEGNISKSRYIVVCLHQQRIYIDCFFLLP